MTAPTMARPWAEAAPVVERCAVCNHAAHSGQCLVFGCRCEPVVAPPPAAEMAVRIGHCVLVSHDEHRRGEVAGMLADLGWETAIASDYSEGILAITAVEGPPQAVVLDVLAPREGLSMPQFHRWLRVAREGLGFEIVYLVAKHGRFGIDWLGPRVAKPAKAEQLREALRVCRGAGIAAAGTHVNAGRLLFVGPAGEARITPTEAALLGYLTGHHGRVIGYVELMRNVWGYAEDRPREAAQLLRSHVSNLRRKLAAAGEPGLVHTVRGRGYCVDAALPVIGY